MQKSSTNSNGAQHDILVKDKDGTMKVFADGKLIDLEQYAVRNISEPPLATDAQKKEQHLAYPKFTDLAILPKDEGFGHIKKDSAPEAADAKVDFYFHDDDKNELQKELDKINTLFQVNAQKQYSVVKIAEKLREKHNLKLHEHDEKKFISIILSLFRQTRSFAQARELLQAPSKMDGLAINEDSVDHILGIVRQLKEKIEKVDGIVIGTDATTQSPKQTRASSMHLDAERATMPAIETSEHFSQPPIKTIQPKLNTVSMPVIPPPVMPVQPKPVLSIPAKSVTAKQPEPKLAESTAAKSLAPEPKPAESTAAKTITPASPVVQNTAVKSAAINATRPGWSQVNRPQVASPQQGMHEVARPAQSTTRLTGKVDELSEMNLQTFRLLDEDPRIRAGKILGKIQTLEKESLTRKAQGIQAWRGNEVYRLYLHLGQVSLEKKKQVADIIAEFTSEGIATLTLDEFEAISDLNKSLRY